MSERFTFFSGTDHLSVYSSAYEVPFVSNASRTAMPQQFWNVEQYTAYHHALFVGDKGLANLILQTKNPQWCQRLCQHIHTQAWHRRKYQVIKEGHHLKFTQNKALFLVLQATTGTTLVDTDAIGLSALDPRAQDRKQWRGQNDLGVALSELRDEISGRNVHDLPSRSPESILAFLNENALKPLMPYEEERARNNDQLLCCSCFYYSGFQQPFDEEGWCDYCLGPLTQQGRALIEGFYKSH